LRQLSKKQVTCKEEKGKNQNSFTLIRVDAMPERSAISGQPMRNACADNQSFHKRSLRKHIGFLRMARKARIGVFFVVWALAGCQQGQDSAGLVAYYRLDGNGKDASGHRINGIVQGVAPTTDRLGNSNSACLFDGVSSGIDYGNPRALRFRHAFTVSAWIQPQAGGGLSQMIAVNLTSSRIS
jgi:hypothetical protein